MTNELVDSNNDDTEVVYISNDLPISMKVIQSIYNEITGKTEEQAKILRDNHELTMEDIVQLNHKITQLQEQYNIISKNCVVTVYHMDDCKDQFSTFERFRMYDKSKVSACENIRLTYNFLIMLPKLNKPQSYKIEIDLHSRIALRKKAHNMHGVSRRVISIFATQTGRVSIEYIDYTVARTFMTAIDEWYKYTKKNKQNKLIEWIQDRSEHLPFILKVITVFVVLLSAFFNAAHLLGDKPSIETLFKSSVIAFGLVYVSSMLAVKLGTTCEVALDSYQTISGLRLNRGDEIAFEEYQEDNRKNIRFMFLTALTTIGLNVISSMLTKFLGLGS